MLFLFFSVRKRTTDQSKDSNLSIFVLDTEMTKPVQKRRNQAVHVVEALHSKTLRTPHEILENGTCKSNKLEMNQQGPARNLRVVNCSMFVYIDDHRCESRHVKTIAQAISHSNHQEHGLLSCTCRLLSCSVPFSSVAVACWRSMLNPQAGDSLPLQGGRR